MAVPRGRPVDFISNNDGTISYKGKVYVFNDRIISWPDKRLGQTIGVCSMDYKSWKKKSALGAPDFIENHEGHWWNWWAKEDWLVMFSGGMPSVYFEKGTTLERAWEVMEWLAKTVPYTPKEVQYFADRQAEYDQAKKARAALGWK